MIFFKWSVEATRQVRRWIYVLQLQGRAEVADLDELVVLANQDIIWLDVSVDDAVLPHMGQGKHTMHWGLQVTNGTLTLAGALFQEAYTCTPAGCTSRDHNSKPKATISTLSLPLFIRHY